MGGYLLEALIERGIEPVALVREGSDLRLVDRLAVEKRFFNLSDLDSLNEALRGGAILFNVAGKVSDWGGWKEFHAVNVRGTLNLLLAARKNRVKRFVQVSSISAYGMRFFDSSLLAEDAPYRPSPVGRDFYCRSKYLAEEEVRRAAAETGIEFVILRPGMIVGERDSAITRRILSIVQGHRRILNVGRLEEKVQFSHARDVVRAVILAGLQGPPNEVYNVSSPPEITKSEFWSRVLKTLHLSKKIVEVPYSLALFAGWMSEQMTFLYGNGREPEATLWSIYLMGNRNIIESSKIFQLGWTIREDLGESIEHAFRPYLNAAEQEVVKTRWRDS